MNNLLANRIAQLLVDAGVLESIPVGVEIHRTRAGHWQRSAGAMSWILWWPEYTISVGSQFPASLVAKGFTVYESFGMIQLDPIPEQIERWNRIKARAKKQKKYVWRERTPEHQAVFEKMMLRGW